jgi:mannose-6-phosphate isomerase-like protein (cupin superfamily)
MGDLERRGRGPKGVGPLEDAHQCGRHPKRAAHHGIASIPPGEALHEHRHRQAELYLVLEGNAMVRVGSVARPIEAGSAVFIPGNAVHSCENTGASDLRFAYVLAADSFDDVEYIFED